MSLNAQKALEQAIEFLDAALDGVESASTEELLQARGLMDSLSAHIDLFESKAVSLIAERERDSDDAERDC